MTATDADAGVVAEGGVAGGGGVSAGNGAGVGAGGGRGVDGGVSAGNGAGVGADDSPTAAPAPGSGAPGRPLRLDVISIFPNYLAPLRESLVGRAIADGLLRLQVHDLRNWATDRHRTVDDTPYGGGAGMVMRPDVWGRALDEVAGEQPTLVVPTPAGRLFDQRTAAELAGADQLIFACGRYEGIDQRVVDDAARHMPVFELSLGDYVLAGGEVAVLVMVEAIARLRPGVLGNPHSAVDDSFGAGLPGLLEGPAYTRPPVYRGLEVPDVLLSGNHAAIAAWRRSESLRRTASRRPELLSADAGSTVRTPRPPSGAQPD